MTSEALIQLAMKAKSCNQRALSEQLGVSPAQISKWKKGEYMSQDMEDRLRDLAGIDDLSPSFVLISGGLENAKNWKKLIAEQAESASVGAETGYDTPLLTDDELLDLLCDHTFATLQGVGVEIPSHFPAELRFPPNAENAEQESDEDAWDTYHQEITRHPVSGTIQQMFAALVDLQGFYFAYVSELMNDDALDLYGTEAENIEPYLIELAASKIELDPDVAPLHRQFSRRVKSDYLRWLELVKNKAFSAGVPLRAELTDLVYDTNEGIGQNAEAESFGFNASRIHPDIYMNELLVGMRTLHQVLPFLLEKMGYDKEFELDASELRLGTKTPED